MFLIYACDLGKPVFLMKYLKVSEGLGYNNPVYLRAVCLLDPLLQIYRCHFKSGLKKYQVTEASRKRKS